VNRRPSPRAFGSGEFCDIGDFVAVRKSFLVYFHGIAEFLNPGLSRLEMERWVLRGWRWVVQWRADAGRVAKSGPKLAIDFWSCGLFSISCIGFRLCFASD
jgi:hypothetical protein